MGDYRITGTQYETGLLNSKDWKSTMGDKPVDLFIEKQLRNILSSHKKPLRQCEKKALANFIKYEVNINNLAEQFELFKRLEKPRANSIENYTIKYGPIHGLRKYKQKNKDCTVTLETFISKHGPEKGRKMWTELNAKKYHNEETYVKKYGEELGRVRWIEFKEKCSKNKTLHKFIQLYGEEAGREKYERTKQKEKMKHTLDGLIKRHGAEKGKALYIKMRKALKHATSREGYIDKYGEVLGKKLCYERHARTLEAAQKKYGVTEGTRKHNQRIEKIKQSMSINGFIEKFGDVEGKQKYDEFMSKKQNRKSASKVSQRLFWDITNAIQNKEITKYFKFFEHGKEYAFYSSRLGKNIMFDFVDTKNKKCIEFNGDIFHGNPSIYSENCKPHPWRKNVSCLQLWAEDREKNQEIQQRGFDLLVLWENDYAKDPEKALKECLNFLGHENQIKN